MCTLGSLGNGCHHYILADERKKRNETTGYIFPTDIERGMFAWTWGPSGNVTRVFGFKFWRYTPHYFCELWFFAGFIFFNRSLYVWLVVFAMTTYLTLRTVRTIKWYEALEKRVTEMQKYQEQHKSGLGDDEKDAERFEAANDPNRDGGNSMEELRGSIRRSIFVIEEWQVQATLNLRMSMMAEKAANKDVQAADKASETKEQGDGEAESRSKKDD